MSTSVALLLQNQSLLNQALVLARIAEGRSEDRLFAPADIRSLFLEIGLPPPTRISNTISALKSNDLIVRSDGGGYKLSPLGRSRSIELMTDVDIAALEAESSRTGESHLGLAPHPVVPPSLAPPVLLQPLATFLSEHPFETNVFGMTRFPDDDEHDPDPVAPALEIAREVCAAHGLEFHLASDRAIHDDLWTNVAGHMWASRYGIAFFEDQRGRGVNYNLTIEVGGMIITGRRCALLKDTSIDKLPTDLVGMIYKSVDLNAPDSVSDALHGWLERDLNLGRCGSCPAPTI